MAQRANVVAWREVLENAWPTGTFAKYLWRSPEFMARKFGSDAIEEWQLAAKFAVICAEANVIRDTQKNWILMNQNLFGTQLVGALVNQEALNLLCTNCPDLELGGNIAIQDLVAEMNQEIDAGDDGQILQGPQQRQRIGDADSRADLSYYPVSREEVFAQDSLHR